ncbi:hypothetical protein EVAR_19040_1 [Eumeta japonica]|uniref:Uncharacterized protein n=1 Tax=Eumeta variegata TaxID=151549 RepID=A0A4C1V7I5_EUMVA|nr:hypothetical protein EVAR_19040_1 [Eumeta japonica]
MESESRLMNTESRKFAQQLRLNEANTSISSETNLPEVRYSTFLSAGLVVVMIFSQYSSKAIECVECSDMLFLESLHSRTRSTISTHCAFKPNSNKPLIEAPRIPPRRHAEIRKNKDFIRSLSQPVRTSPDDGARPRQKRRQQRRGHDESSMFTVKTERTKAYY